jgi:Na+/melibiose symporter-like transporter
MLSNIAVCPLASFILTLVIIINILGVYLVGFQFAIIVTNVLISIFFVWLANKTCDRYQWVSWLITAYFIICIIGAVALIIMPSETREGFVEGAKSKESKESKESKNKNKDEDEDKDE